MLIQSLHPLAARATRIELSRHSHLRIAVHEPRRFKIVGMQKEPLPQPMPHILIQVAACYSFLTSCYAFATDFLGTILTLTRSLAIISGFEIYITQFYKI